MNKVATVIAAVLTTLLGGTIGAVIGLLAALTFNGISALIAWNVTANIGVTAAIIGGLCMIVTCAMVVPIAGDEFKKEAE